jgi:hypothetical protein
MIAISKIVNISGSHQLPEPNLGTVLELKIRGYQFFENGNISFNWDSFFTQSC